MTYDAVGTNTNHLSFTDQELFELAFEYGVQQVAVNPGTHCATQQLVSQPKRLNQAAMNSHGKDSSGENDESKQPQKRSKVVTTHSGRKVKQIVHDQHSDDNDDESSSDEFDAPKTDIDSVYAKFFEDKRMSWVDIQDLPRFAVNLTDAKRAEIGEMRDARARKAAMNKEASKDSRLKTKLVARHNRAAFERQATCIRELTEELALLRKEISASRLG